MKGDNILSKDILVDVQQHIDNGEKVAVMVGDFGEKQMARINKVVVVHVIFISKSDRMHYDTELLNMAPEAVDSILGSLKKLVSPFYFVSEFGDNEYDSFRDLFA